MHCHVCGKQSDKLIQVLDRKLCPDCERAAWERIMSELKRIGQMTDREFDDYMDAERKAA